MKFNYPIIFLFLFVTQSLLSQTGFDQQHDTLVFIQDNFDETEVFSLNTDSLKLNRTSDVVRVVDAFAYTLSSPIRWKEKQWLHAGGTLASVAVLSLADKSIHNVVQKNADGFPTSFADFGYHNGKPYAAFAIAGGFYLTGAIINDDWTRETALALTSTYMTSGVMQAALKKIVGRGRPSEGEGPFVFHPFRNDAGYSSFPSGHSQIAYVTAFVLAERVNQPWLKVVFYSGAAMTMLSRMYANAHWFSDVAFGGFLAYICTKTTLRRLEENKYKHPWKKSKKAVDWDVYPVGNGIGFRAVF